MKTPEQLREVIRDHVEYIKYEAGDIATTLRFAGSEILYFLNPINLINRLREGRGAPLTTDTFMADKGQPYHLD